MGVGGQSLQSVVKFSYLFFKMKPEKVFVRYKNLNQAPAYPRERNDKRPYQKKKYAEKSNKTREPFKIIYDSFIQVAQPSKLVQKLSASYSGFFAKEGRAPEKDSNELLNEYLIFNTKKFLESLKDPKKDAEPIMSSSEPDWNSNEEIDSDMESKVIEENVIEKFVEKTKDRPIRKAGTLKPHEKRFLEDYFKEKRLKEQEELENNPQSTPPETKIVDIAQKKENSKKQDCWKKEEIQSVQDSNSKVSWSEYQERQVNTFVDMGFMTKIEENEEDNPVEIVEDDDLFNEEDSNKSSKSKSSPRSESEEEDDIFGDDSPTTTVKTKKQPEVVKLESQKKITQGTVVINQHIFSTIAEAVGLLPARCNWIIKNDYNKYKVSTDYMDAYYRKEKMYEILPLISLNHSAFVNNSQIGTPEALEQFRDFNYRRSQQTHFQNNRQKQYKEKNIHHNHTHLKKK